MSNEENSNKRKRSYVDPYSKVLYKEDNLFAGVSKKGEWYLSFTTMNPKNQFKSVYITPLPEKPSDEYILREEVSPKGIKIILDKDGLASWLAENHEISVSSDSSPFKPVPLGVSKKEFLKDYYKSEPDVIRSNIETLTARLDALEKFCQNLLEQDKK